MIRKGDVFLHVLLVFIKVEFGFFLRVLGLNWGLYIRQVLEASLSYITQSSLLLFCDCQYVSQVVIELAILLPQSPVYLELQCLQALLRLCFCLLTSTVKL